jgi:hypothetical protein
MMPTNFDKKKYVLVEFSPTVWFVPCHKDFPTKYFFNLDL